MGKESQNQMNTAIFGALVYIQNLLVIYCQKKKVKHSIFYAEQIGITNKTYDNENFYN